MQTIKGPGLFLAQFIQKKAPFNSLLGLAKWASQLGFKAVQIPCNEKTIFDVDLASKSQTYCDDVVGILAQHNIQISELSTHLQGQLIAVHPAYHAAFNNFAPKKYQNSTLERQQWAVETLKQACLASKRMNIKTHATFSGALAWPYFYPWPPRKEGLVDAAFAELARLWRPILDFFDEQDVDICYELHPGEDLHDGVTFERFLEAVDFHPRCNILYDPSHMLLQHMDYLAFIDIYHDRIKAFHVKDAELQYSGRTGVYGGYLPWIERAGRFRSLGDGQVDFKAIFSKLAQYDYSGWAVLEWECCLKDSAVGAAEGAKFIKENIIQVSDRQFDDFANTGDDQKQIKQLLGL